MLSVGVWTKNLNFAHAMHQQVLVTLTPTVTLRNHDRDKLGGEVGNVIILFIGKQVRR